MAARSSDGPEVDDDLDLAELDADDADDPDELDADLVDGDLEDELDDELEEDLDSDVAEDEEESLDELEDSFSDDDEGADAVLPIATENEDGDPLALSAFDEDAEEEVVRVVTEDDDEDGTIDGLRDGEFVCRSCFMAKRESALADPERMLCRDCA